jgi:subtilisin family serine protease
MGAGLALYARGGGTNMKDYNRKLVFALVAMVVVLSGFPGGVAIADDGQDIGYIGDMALEPMKPLFKNPKMVSVLAELVDLHKRAVPAEVQSFAAMRQITMSDDRVQVVLVMSDETQSLSGYKNIEIEAWYKNLVQALVPVSELEILADDPAVHYIRQPLRPHPAVVSEGVEVINATTLHAMGIDGTGVKVAVIDGGFYGYDTSPEIWNVVEAVSFRADGDITGGGETHGTACAEVILDVAPDVSLYLYNFDTDVTFGNAVDYSISQGVDIISCSWGWANAGPYDGTGFICDIANNASSSGILFVNSAGNYADMHYEGPYNDTDEDGWHEFSTSPVDEILDLGTIPAYYPITLLLSWDDWDVVDQDYELYLMVWNVSAGAWDKAAWSVSVQNGNAGQEPTEAIDFYLYKEMYCGVTIKNYSSRGDAHFELYSYTNRFPEHNVASSSLAIPADAEGVMTVGATYWKDDRLEYFSSQGPTNDGRIKPDVVAPDGVSSSIYGDSTGNHDADQTNGVSFFGTSASCPHVAGAAALVLDKHPSLSNTELQDYLESHAKDLDVPGKDGRTGSGRIDVYQEEDTTPPASITNLHNTTYEQTYITWTWNDPADADFSHVMVYIDGAFKTNVTKGVQQYTATGLAPDTEHEIGTHTVDDAGNINAAWVKDTARTKPEVGLKGDFDGDGDVDWDDFLAFADAYDSVKGDPNYNSVGDFDDDGDIDWDDFLAFGDAYSP